MTTAWVLPGGGARGAYQVGMMLELHRAGITPSAIYGTSVGAVNGLAYAMTGRPEVVGSIWRSVRKRSDLMALDLWPLLRGRWQQTTVGFLNLNPLENKLVNLGLTVRGDALKCSYSCTYVDLETSNLHFYHVGRGRAVQEMLEEAIYYTLASATYPMVCRPIDGRFVDGGLREAAPLRQAMLHNHTKVYVLSTHPEQEDPGAPVRNVVEYAQSCVETMLKEILRNDLEHCQTTHWNHSQPEVIHISPGDVRGLKMGALEFDPMKITGAIEHGKRAVRQHFMTRE